MKSSLFLFFLCFSTHFFSQKKVEKDLETSQKEIEISTVGLDDFEYVGNPQLRIERNNQLDIVLSRSLQNINIYLDLFYSKFKGFCSG